LEGILLLWATCHTSLTGNAHTVVIIIIYFDCKWVSTLAVILQ
jgi:hypothetical protein